MMKDRVEVITSVERRRQWHREEKERLVAAWLELGAVISEIARAAGIHTSQLLRLREDLCQIERPSTPAKASKFVPVVVSEGTSATPPIPPEALVSHSRR